MLERPVKVFTAFAGISGAEQELAFVDEAMRPAPLGPEVLEIFYNEPATTENVVLKVPSKSPQLNLIAWAGAVASMPMTASGMFLAGSIFDPRVGWKKTKRLRHLFCDGVLDSHFAFVCSGSWILQLPYDVSLVIGFD